MGFMGPIGISREIKLKIDELPESGLRTELQELVVKLQMRILKNGCGSIKQAIIHELENYGPATSYQIAVAIGTNAHVVRSRMSDLRARGVVQRSESVYRNEHGKFEVMWELAVKENTEDESETEPSRLGEVQWNLCVPRARSRQR